MWIYNDRNGHILGLAPPATQRRPSASRGVHRLGRLVPFSLATISQPYSSAICSNCSPQRAARRPPRTRRRYFGHHHTRGALMERRGFMDNIDYPWNRAKSTGAQPDWTSKPSSWRIDCQPAPSSRHGDRRTQPGVTYAQHYRLARGFSKLLWCSVITKTLALT